MPAQNESKTPVVVPVEDVVEPAPGSEPQTIVETKVEEDLSTETRRDVSQEIPAVPQIVPDHLCPVCGGKLINEKCKVVCRSEMCVYRLVFNCSEY